MPSSTITSYLQKMQRGGITQSFGCLLAVEEESFRILAYSENASEMLDLLPQAVPSIGQKSILGEFLTAPERNQEAASRKEKPGSERLA